MLAKQRVAALHIVDRRNLGVDVLDTAPVCGDEREAVVNLAQTEQRELAYPVTDACIAYLGPEMLIATGIPAEQTDVTETRNSRVARHLRAIATDLRRNREFDASPAGVTKGYDFGHRSEERRVGKAVGQNV